MKDWSSVARKGYGGLAQVGLERVEEPGKPGMADLLEDPGNRKRIGGFVD